jgi:predicted membrane protein
MLVRLQNQKCTIEFVGTLLDLLLGLVVAFLFLIYFCESEYCCFARKNLMYSMY